LENDNLVSGKAHLCKVLKENWMMNIPESIRQLIAKAPFAHLTTLNPTGGPQVTLVWVGIENEEFVIGHPHLPTYQKLRNIQRDPRIALSMLSDTTNAQGLREYLLVHGDARVTDGGAFDLLQRLGLFTSDRTPSIHRRHAQYSRLDHPNHTRAFCRSRAMGCVNCSRMSDKLVR
jgi:PPOX class probable F420-dependent enzyme